MEIVEKIAALRIERKKIGELREHPKNPRIHGEVDSPQWAALAKSLEHDYFDPLVWNERNGMLVSGHFRRKVLESQGVTHVDVSVVDYDEATHEARLIAANRMFGEFDETALAELMEGLQEAGLDGALAGFSAAEWNLEQIADEPEAVVEVADDSETAAELVSVAEELQKQWLVKAGDLYRISGADGVYAHLYCGDCTKLETWDFLVGDRIVDLVWTDPPYNVAYNELQNERNGKSEREGKTPRNKPEVILNDHLGADEYRSLLFNAFSRVFERAKAGAPIYIAHASSEAINNQSAMIGAGWLYKQQLVWVKNAFTLTRQDYKYRHEPIFYGWKPGAAHCWYGGYDKSTVIDDQQVETLDASELKKRLYALLNEQNTSIIREPRNTETFGHPTIKPVSLVSHQIQNSSRVGELVVDCFGGSGTTLYAALATGRYAAAPELDPKFCAVILERGKKLGYQIEKIHESS